MTEVNATPAKLTLYRLILVDGAVQPGSVIYEGDIPVADLGDVDLKQIIGDGLSKVTASRELSEKSYGNGGSVHLSISITCDQSLPVIDWAVNTAKQLTAKYAQEHHAELKTQLQQLGILP